jgi:hypothetical protein
MAQALPGSPFSSTPPPPKKVVAAKAKPAPTGKDPKQYPHSEAFIRHNYPPPPTTTRRGKEEPKVIGNTGRDPGYRSPDQRHPDTGDGGGGGGGYSAPEPFGGGGGGGGGGFSEPEPVPITWADTYNVEGAPAWWKGRTPSALDPNSEYAMLVNALIPYMSPEDQRMAGSNLAQLFPDAFGGYNLEVTPPPPTAAVYQPAPKTQRAYFDQSRAIGALGTLDKVRTIMGKEPKDLGPGYQYLRNIATAHRNYGGTIPTPQTRAQYQQLMGMLDPLLGQAKNENLAAYGPIAQAFALPFTSSGPLRDTFKDETGRMRFGRPNPILY